MKIKNTFFIVLVLMLAIMGCSQQKGLRYSGATDAASTSPAGTTANDPAGTASGSSSTGSGAGNGMNFAGTGSLSVTTADGIVMKIQNGLGGSAKATAGNFATALTQLRSNLPKVADPSKATGYDQVQLLVYAACSDLTTGGTPIMQSKYNVNPNATIAVNQAALVAAGMNMLDAHLAGLASQGPAQAQVSTALNTLVTQVGGVAGNTSKIAFMSVCIAANTVGSTMLGF